MSQEFVYLLTALFTSAATLAAVWLRHRLTCEDHCEVLEKEMKQNANVYTALQFTLEESGADRAYVLEFHNGEHYFSGRGQQKFSCTYEVVREGISAEAGKSQNYRVSNFHNYINTLVQDGVFAHSELETIEDYGFSKLLEQKGVQSIYNVSLKTLNGKIIGILGLDYVRTPSTAGKIGFTQKPKGAIALLKEQARIIAGYLV
tara:strand:+ start:2297 stop:2905 length:609 start_codon:yes stop_codon:yes gene_type:complete